MNNEFIEFAKSLFDTKPLLSNGGYTWTLASRTGDMLYEMQCMFGERDKSWTILGVEINVESSIPQNWYPCGNDRKNIVFQLVPPANRDVLNANYQLAHEVVHSLSPNIELRVNVLEEGLATWFARYYVRKHFGAVLSEDVDSYKAARETVERLLAVNDEAIKKLRSVEPCFKKMTSVTFEKAGLAVEPELMQSLLSSFERC